MRTIPKSGEIVNGYTPYKRFRGALIPNWLMRRSEVSQGAKLCFARLIQHAGKAASCYPRLETLAGELGVSERTVKDYIAELVKLQFISKQRMGQGRANTYHFLLHPWIEFADDRQDSSSQASIERQDSSSLERQYSSHLDRQDSAPPILRDSEKRISESQESVSEDEFRKEAERKGLKWGRKADGGFCPGEKTWNYWQEHGGIKDREHMKKAIATAVQYERSRKPVSHL